MAKRIFITGFWHETNTFAPTRTGLEDFHAYQYAEGDGLFEAFADRGYDPDGYLLPRNQPGAVHHDPERILAQALSFARGEPITASDGSQLTLRANSLCVHGDNAESVAVVARIRAALDAL